MAKRKRPEPEPSGVRSNPPTTNGQPSKITKTNGHVDVKTTSPIIQIITGSYERVLHGITATISTTTNAKTPAPATVDFADAFLFNAHDSSIRCLALSPMPDAGSDDRSLYLATGGSDEKVNVFSLSASPMPANSSIPPMPTLGDTKVQENPRNRELGALLSHSSNITALHFPSRSKLLSGSEDNTIAISRLRDLTTVSTIKAPRPAAVGQPSGDTAPVGATPAGINDFAIHPSMKLMLSVGRGERCMRLWNLVTGKKAGVLSFEKSVLQGVKEGRYSSGEGRRIRWNATGTEFAVAFERGLVVFGEDSKPKRRVLPAPLSKLHQVWWGAIGGQELLAVSTEDGRIVFFDTMSTSEGDEQELPNAQAVMQLGGRAAGVVGRIKDFAVLSIPDQGRPATAIVTASSDGSVRLWSIQATELDEVAKQGETRQVGTLLGTYDSGDRITCLAAFVMLPPRSEDEADFQDNDEDFEGFSEDESSGGVEDEN